jgi:signal transduction histidine kinase/GAF domain-containing protein
MFHHQFHYREIGQELVHELADLVTKGQSVALFSPRFGGKRHVMDRVLKEVEATGLTPIVRLRLLDEKNLVTYAQLASKMQAALVENGIDEAAPATDPFQAIEAYAMRTGKRVILFAANIDAIAHGVTQLMLQRFRKLVESKSLVVILSGESNLHEIVHGENSDFTCTENYFLQGYAKKEFGHFFYQYFRTLSIPLAEPEKTLELLWHRTGGNTFLLRPWIVEVAEKKVRAGIILKDQALSVEDFDRFPNSKELPGYYWTQLCRHATRMVAWDHTCWESLEKLLRGEEVEVGISPTALEWYGIATRKDGKLRVASEMMQRYITHHYTDLCFGDLYARIRDWNRAFQYYGRLNIEHRRRPISTDDRTDIERAVNAFGMALFSEATKGDEELKSLFVRGCKYLLGFSEVTFWRHEGEWKQRPVGSVYPEISNQVLTKVSEMLSDCDRTENGVYILPSHLADYAIAAKLQSAYSDYTNAVVVSEFETQSSISRERKRLLEILLRQFIEAHTHAIVVSKNEWRLGVRNQQIKLINEIFEAMGGQVLDVDEVLKRAAGRLLDLGMYQRVLFCLVDPKRERIQGVYELAPKSSVNVAALTDYSLMDIERDIQPYVIHTKKPFVTADATRERLMNRDVVEATGMKAVAIVPIINHVINHDGDAIGTIHVERQDHVKPPREEIEDLMDFGRLLATAIEQAERVNLLQSTLDKLPEPITIVTPNGRFRYGNKAASNSLGISNQWQLLGESRMSLEQTHPTVREAVEQSLQGQKVFQTIQDENAFQTVISDHITDWRRKTVGAYLHIQEQTDLYRAFEAFSKIALNKNTSDALDAMLDVAKLLRYKVARLYVIDKSTGMQVSKRCYGMLEQEEAAAFDRGEIVLPRKGSDYDSWHCIDRMEPVVFCYDPNRQDGERSKTALGLDYIVVTNPYPHNRLRKQPGDFWVEVPILAHDQPLGKLTLPCDEYFRPESFELLKVLSNLEAGLFNNFLSREREQYERDRILLGSATQKVMTDVAHNIATRFGSFPPFLSLYRRFEDRIPELKKVNDNFSHALDQAQTIVKRAKERLAPIVKLQPRQTDLVPYLHQVCRSALPQGGCAVRTDSNHVEMEFDNHLLEAALLEMIENSKNACPPSAELQVEISVALLPGSTDQVRVIYRDNGYGVPDEARAQIFDDFFSHRPGQGNGHIGLGMGFIKRVIEAHGGTIELGRPAQGAEFIITLPRDASAEGKTTLEKRNVSIPYR